METLGSLRRTNYCGEVTLAMAGQEMTVCGSIARARDKGGIIFADLRDTTGILQLVFDEDTPKDVFAKAESLKSEYVVICRGKLRERAAKTDKIATGDVELYVSELRILSEAQTTPFELRDEINVNDDLRLRYRYLDLRRPSMHEPIVLRSKIMQIIRNYFCENHFTEIETPTLIKSTPEGARDYLVPSRVQPGHFYALPQSPQLYKQILMLSGFDRYFQLAHCYRDEDLRADRQPEFTQVDEEMSFVSEDDIMTLNEGLIKRLWKEMLNVDVETPFYRMPWDEAMGRFGSDKPDTRFGLEIQDVTEVFRGTEFKPFAAVLEAGGTIRAINAKGLADKLSRKNIDKLGEVAKTYGAKGLAYLAINEIQKLAAADLSLTLVLVVVAAIFFIAFWNIEKKKSAPMVSTRYLKQRRTWGLLLTTLLTMTGVFAIMNGVVPAIAQDPAMGVDMGADIVSFATLTPYALLGLAFGPVAGVLASKFGYHKVLRGGLIVSIIGALFGIFVSNCASVVSLVVISVILGIAYAGTANIMLNGLGIVLSPKDNPGYLPGMNAGAFNLGAGLSFAILYAAMDTVTATSGAAAGYAASMIAGAILLVAALAVSFLIPKESEADNS